MSQSQSTPEPAPPESSSGKAPVHSPTNVALATLLGTPLAGALALSSNDTPLGTPGKNSGLVVPSGILGLALAVGVYRTPQFGIAWAVIAFVLAGAFSVLAWNRQGAAFREHVSNGGPVTNPVFALAMGAFCAVVLVGATHMVTTFVFSEAGGRVNIKGDQYVYYSDGGAEPEARAVGAFLARTPYPGESLPFFNGDHPADARVTREKDMVVVSFVLAAGAWENNNTVNGYTQLGQQLGAELFQGSPLRLDLTDANWMAHRKLPIR